MHTHFQSILNISAKCHQKRSLYNFELYHFKVCAFFWDTVYTTYFQRLSWSTGKKKKKIPHQLS